MRVYRVEEGYVCGWERSITILGRGVFSLGLRAMIQCQCRRGGARGEGIYLCGKRQRERNLMRKLGGGVGFMCGGGGQ